MRRVASKPFNTNYRINLPNGQVLLNGEQVARIEVKKADFTTYYGVTENQWQIIFYMSDGGTYTVGQAIGRRTLPRKTLVWNEYSMSEEETKLIASPELMKKILNKLEDIGLRLQNVEERLNRHSLDTRPIWEKALAEVMGVKQDVAAIDRKIDVLAGDLLNIRAAHLDVERRVIRLEDDTGGGVQTVN